MWYLSRCIPCGDIRFCCDRCLVYRCRQCSGCMHGIKATDPFQEPLITGPGGMYDFGKQSAKNRELLALFLRETMAQYKEIPELGPGVFGFDLAKGEVTKINGRYPKLLASAWLLREMCDLACIVNVPCSAHEGLRCDRQEEDPEFWHEYRTVPHKLSVVGFGLAFAALAEKRNIRSVDVDPLLNGPDSAVDDVGFVKVDRTSAEKAAAVTTGEPSTTEPVAETSADTKRDTKLHGLSRLVKAAKLGSKVSPPNIPKVH